MKVAKKVVEVQPAIPAKMETTYVLELTQEEAQHLRNILGAITISDTRTTAMYKELVGAGLKHATVEYQVIQLKLY